MSVLIGQDESVPQDVGGDQSSGLTSALVWISKFQRANWEQYQLLIRKTSDATQKRRNNFRFCYFTFLTMKKRLSNNKITVSDQK